MSEAQISTFWKFCFIILLFCDLWKICITLFWSSIDEKHGVIIEKHHMIAWLKLKLWKKIVEFKIFNLSSSARGHFLNQIRFYTHGLLIKKSSIFLKDYLTKWPNAQVLFFLFTSYKHSHIKLSSTYVRLVDGMLMSLIIINMIATNSL